MKRFSIFSLILIGTLILSACGARTAATPIATPIDIQGTMAAAAFTMVAETQAALPTATPVPPTATVTDTPLPTNTFLPLPSEAATSASGGNAGGADPCVNKPLPSTLKGDTVKIRIDNSTKATLSISVYLNQSGPQTECGYRTYTLEPQKSLYINDLVEGCYTVWAWNPDPKDYFIVTNGTSCIDTSTTSAFNISTRTIEFR